MFYGIDDEASRDRLARAIKEIADIFGSAFAADELIAVGRNTAFLEDERLQSAVETGLASIRDPYLRRQAESKMWRLHCLTWAATSTLGLPGDLVECGAFDGFTAFVVASYTDLNSTRKSFYLYDTFSGLSEKYATPEELSKNEFYKSHPEAFDVCSARFTDYPRVRIVRGVVPDVLEQSAPERVSFLNLDLNCALAEKAALEFFFDRVENGGIIFLDDYGKKVFRSQTAVADSFFAARNHAVLELPTGQGMVIKRDVANR